MITTIKGKLIFCISLTIVILFSMVLYIFNQLSVLNEQMTRMVDVAAERIILSNEVMYQVMDVTRNEKNIILENDHAEKIQLEAEINHILPNIDNKILSLEQKTNTDAGRNVLSKFKSTWIQYNKIINEIIALSKENNSEAAYKLSRKEARNLRSEAVIILNQIIDYNKELMKKDKEASEEAHNFSMRVIIILISIALLLSAMLTYWIINSITSRINQISEGARKIASRQINENIWKEKINDELNPVAESLHDIYISFREVALKAHEIAKGDYSIKVPLKSDHDFIGNSLNTMSQTLWEITKANNRHNWLTAGQTLLNEQLIGDQEIEQITENAIVFISEYTKANIGALYLAENRHTLKLSARFAFSAGEIAKETYFLGEGLPGQAAASRKLIHLTNLKQENLRLASSIVNAKPENVIVIPFFKDEVLMGVVELGKIDCFTDDEVEFLKNSMPIMGVTIFSAISRRKILELLEETQRQGEELQAQQEELKQLNEELEEQTQNLKYQQEELQIVNEELEEQTQSIELKNKELELANAEIEKKKLDIEMSSRYKSQFLANMSHELRTPLNSLLILSKDLSNNKKGNLDETQVETATIINKSGNDLLMLINEVLDLAKIESGKMELHIEDVFIEEFILTINRNFAHMAKEKGLELSINKDPLLPEFIKTDSQRLDQIVKNLLSNAIKFTHRGSITVNLRREQEDSVAIEVKDTGIGIPEDKQTAVFEAFQQADGGTSRKYGGTGLGLSISRELIKLLRGKIKLSSKINEGSVFTIIIPISLSAKSTIISPEIKLNTPPATIIHKNEAYINYPAISDDRDSIKGNDKSLLIIEDDLMFAEILKKQATSKSFKVLMASSGEDGLLLAERFLPKAIILDLNLPGMDGKSVLFELKANPGLRHIPVHIISAVEKTLEPIKAGAIEYLLKPVDKDQLEAAFIRIENFINRKMKNLLIVEDDENSRKSIKLLIGNGDVKCLEAGSGNEAWKILQENSIDCIVLDLGLPDISGFELIKKMQEQKIKLPPIIIYTGKELSKQENEELHSFAESIIIKGVKSEERLLDETALFLHRTVKNLPEDKKDIIKELYNKDTIFQNKKILVVDDDMRNVFALSKVLMEYGMEIVKAENGLKAIEALAMNSDIDMVLMDVMMPEMDGLEAIRRIRGMDKHKDLPILSLTAKAMKEDRKKCIDAGANDYISKPIEIERLLSLMKIWIKK